MNKIPLILILIFAASVSLVGTMENFVGLSVQEMFMKSTNDVNCFCDDSEVECIVPPDQTACDLVVPTP